MNTAERNLARRIASGLAHCLPITAADYELTCESCPYYEACENGENDPAPVRFSAKMVQDIRKLVTYDLD